MIESGVGAGRVENVESVKIGKQLVRLMTK